MKIITVATSRHKGTPKSLVESAFLREGYGIDGDAHAGDWHRQVSLLAWERIEEARNHGLEVSAGDFAENIATMGIDWKTVPVGSRFSLGESAIIEITQLGKECHNRCAIYYRNGDCIMPREGVFAKVLKGGSIRPGDNISLINGPVSVSPWPERSPEDTQV
ncbi:MAG: MOSC domain-containing protein [Desulfobacteraceae bacterium]|jgi:MOSC domain-containing protein YiiM|nr:MAG: MOSC domain-containing protein [Desulfobacteraceae bacterium]